MKKLQYLVLALAVGLTSLVGCGNSAKQEEKSVSTTEKREKTSLLVYAGAGLKHAMEELKSHFEEKNPDIQLDITYAGSGKLLAQLQASKKGDLFIVGSQKDYKLAQQENLVKEGVPVAHHTPTIIVKKGNPLGIESVKDLDKEGVKIVIADPKAAPVGDRAMKIFENAGLQHVEENIVAKVENLPAIVSAVDSGNADAGIATLDSVFENQSLDIVKIPDDINVGMVITAGICAMTQHETQSNLFKDFIVSPEGEKILASHGFYRLAKNE